MLASEGYLYYSEVSVRHSFSLCLSDSFSLNFLFPLCLSSLSLFLSLSLSLSLSPLSLSLSLFFYIHSLLSPIVSIGISLLSARSRSRAR